MTARTPQASTTRRGIRILLSGLSLLALGACSALYPVAEPPPSYYVLDNAQRQAGAPAPLTAPTLVISPAHASAGFDNPRIIYMREPHKLDYFARSEWVDPPARMLGPLLVAALQSTGAFHAVVLTPSTAAGDLRLDTAIIRLQHEFLGHPSQVRFTLRATLVDQTTRKVLAWREFDASVAAASDTPQGGVVAANRAVQTVLTALADFCAEVVFNAQTEP